MKKKFKINVVFGIALTWLILAIVAPAPVLATEGQTLQVGDVEFGSWRVIGAAIAFSSAALASGLAISKAGSAGLAGTAERPEIRTTAIIITALGEALAIYGIVIAILLLGASPA